MGYMKLLMSKYKELGMKVTWEELYSAQDTKSDVDVFKNDLIRFLKKKVKKFTADFEGVEIIEFRSLKSSEMAKYFKFGTEVTEVRIDVLYQSWKHCKTRSVDEFERSLEKQLVNSNLSYFIFHGNLQIKELKK